MAGTTSATCCDCGKQAPATQTDYTLIGAQHGWRVIREKDAAGKNVMSWRCPECWQSHKARTSGKLAINRNG